MPKKTTKPAAPVLMIAGANGHTVLLRPGALPSRAIVQIDDAAPKQDAWVKDITCAVYILLADAPYRIPAPVWESAERAMPADKKLRWIPKRPAPITGEDLGKL